MSESESDRPRPSDAQIARALRDAVDHCFETDDLDSLTHKRVREAAARKLKLPEDFFKSDSKWKVKSKETIDKQVEKQEAGAPASSPEVKKKSSAPASTSGKAKVDSKVRGKTKTTAKKKSPTIASKARKRQKKSDTSDEESEHSDVSVSSIVSHSETPENSEDVKSNTEDKEEPKKQANAGECKEHLPEERKASQEPASESELSVVLDDTPPQRRKRQKSASAEAGKAKSAKTQKMKSESNTATSNPQEEEMKRLQSWLVKCGVRKVWSKELSSCSGEREKITHLKRLLKDAGMTGRFSEEKAKQIKEEREFKADLEAIQEGNKQWGQSDDDDSDQDGPGPGRPKRKIAKGLKELKQFDDDEESSDL